MSTSACGKITGLLAFGPENSFTASIESKRRSVTNSTSFIVANEQFCSVIAFDVAGRDARKNFLAQQFLVQLRVFGLRPAVPDTCDHQFLMVGRDRRARRLGFDY